MPNRTIYVNRLQILEMHFLSSICLLASFFASLDAKEPGKCAVSITPESVADSWQSSAYPDSCFRHPNRLFGKANEYRFFHSGEYNTSADSGYHWFVIELNKTETVRSVTVRSRFKDAYVRNRAADIEVFALETIYNFGSNRCNSKISEHFYESNWHYCGKTKSNVSVGEYLTVHCNRQVRMLLLRKHVAGAVDSYSQCMNFVNMWLNRVDQTDPPSKLRIDVQKGICNKNNPGINNAIVFESSDAPQHDCNAFGASGTQLLMTQMSTEATCDVDGNVMRSHWLCENCSLYNATRIACNADFISIEKNVDGDCPANNKQSVFIITFGVLTTVASFFVALLIVFRRKLCRRIQSANESSANPTNQKMTVLTVNNRAPQKPPLPLDLAARALTHSQQSLYLNGDSSSFAVVDLPSTSECLYEVVSIVRPREQSRSATESFNNESVYIDIVGVVST